MKKYYYISVSYDCRFGGGDMDLGLVSNKEHPLAKSRIKEIVFNRNKDTILGMTMENLTVIVTNIFQFENEQEYQNFWK